MEANEILKSIVAVVGITAIFFVVLAVWLTTNYRKAILEAERRKMMQIAARAAMERKRAETAKHEFVGC